MSIPQTTATATVRYVNGVVSLIPVAALLISLSLVAWLASVLQCFLALRKGEVEEWSSWGLFMGRLGIDIYGGLLIASDVAAGIFRGFNFDSALLVGALLQAWDSSVGKSNGLSLSIFIALGECDCSNS